MATGSPESGPGQEPGSGKYDLVGGADDENGGSLFGESFGDEGLLFGGGSGDEGSLFGGATGDGESLFGEGSGDDVSSSLFTEDVNDCRPAIALPTPESQPGLANASSDGTRASSAQALFHLPTTPDPPDTPLSYQDGHTSGLHVVSTHHPTDAPFTMSRDEELDLEAMMESELHTEQPVNAGISHDGRGQEGHDMTHITPRPPEDEFGQDLDALMGLEFLKHPPADTYSSHDMTNTSPVPSDDIGQDLDALMEFELLRAPAVRGTTGFGSNIAGQDGIGLALSELSGFKLAGAATRHGIRLPRRIDLEEQHVEVLVPYITFTRAIGKGEHFERLELSKNSGKALTKDIRAYLAKSENYRLLSGGTSAKSIEGKMALLKSSFHLLKTQGWGARYFGRHHPQSRQTRRLYWPKDSTLIIYNLALLLYKSVDLEKTRLKTQAAKAARAQFGMANGSRESPIDLSGDVVHFPSPKLGLRPYFSPAFHSAEALSPQVLEELASHPPPRYSTTSGAGGATNFSASLGMDDTRRTNDFTLAVRNTVVSRDVGDSQQGSAPPDATFDLLAQEISKLKRRKRSSATIPADADLKYRFSFKDQDDGQELRPAVTYQQSDELIASGAFVYLQQSFAGVDTPATVLVNTPIGGKRVNSQEEWDAAIRSVWEVGGASGLVEVDVLV